MFFAVSWPGKKLLVVPLAFYLLVIKQTRITVNKVEKHQEDKDKPQEHDGEVMVRLWTTSLK